MGAAATCDSRATKVIDAAIAEMAVDAESPLVEATNAEMAAEAVEAALAEAVEAVEAADDSRACSTEQRQSSQQQEWKQRH